MYLLPVDKLLLHVVVRSILILQSPLSYRELLLQKNQLYDLPASMGKLFKMNELNLLNNPLSPNISNLYYDSNGAQKLLNYFLENNIGEFFS